MGMMTDYISLICPYKTGQNNDQDALMMYKIKNVYTEIGRGINRSDDGQQPVNDTLVVIPAQARCSESYMKPKAWESGTELTKEHNYTLREGDVVVINETPVGCTTLEDIKAKYDDVFTIQGIKEFNKIYPHFELTCK